MKCFNTLWKGDILHPVTDSAHTHGVCINRNAEILNT